MPASASVDAGSHASSLTHECKPAFHLLPHPLHPVPPRDKSKRGHACCYARAQAIPTHISGRPGVPCAGNTNPYIWSAWGWLEFKTANIERARKLFDAATVVSPTHAAAWHKWGHMEKSEGKYARARDLWLKVRVRVGACVCLCSCARPWGGEGGGRARA